MGKSRNAGSANPMRGRHHTDEARARMSAAHLGKKRAPFSEEHRRHISEAMKGKASGGRNHFWAGGRKSDRGYVLVHCPEHPHANGQGYVYEHRLVMEHELGRFLHPNERPHHINGDRSDNRPENLELFENNGDHMIERHVGRDSLGRFCRAHAMQRTREYPTTEAAEDA